MLIIRKKQIEALTNGIPTHFEVSLLHFLREQFSDARDEPDHDLRPAIHEQVQRAFEYNLTTMRQVSIYVICAWLFGQDFDKAFPDARDILQSPLLSPDEKVRWLTQWTDNVFFATQPR